MGHVERPLAVSRWSLLVICPLEERHTLDSKKKDKEVSVLLLRPNLKTGAVCDAARKRVTSFDVCTLSGMGFHVTRFWGFTVTSQKNGIHSSSPTVSLECVA